MTGLQALVSSIFKAKELFHLCLQVNHTVLMACESHFFVQGVTKLVLEARLST